MDRTIYAAPGDIAACRAQNRQSAAIAESGLNALRSRSFAEAAATFSELTQRTRGEEYDLAIGGIVGEAIAHGELGDATLAARLLRYAEAQTEDRRTSDIAAALLATASLRQNLASGSAQAVRWNSATVMQFATHVDALARNALVRNSDTPRAPGRTLA